MAVKVFQRPYKHDVLLQQYKDLREELTIMSHLDHPRVVSLVGVALRPLCMVMQLAPQCSLADHLDLCPHGLQHKVAHSLLFQVGSEIGGLGKCASVTDYTARMCLCCYPDYLPYTHLLTHR